MNKYKKTKGSKWSPRYIGYAAVIGQNDYRILAKSMTALRKIHDRLFPGQTFQPKFCHPANIRRTGD